MSFHEIRFPTDVALGAMGGPERRTEIVTLASGFEERNALWAHSRRRYNAGYGVKTLNDLYAVIAFFEARAGRLHGFRWRDRADDRSAGPQDAIGAGDQAIGTGDGAVQLFPLVKRYQSGAESYDRPIVKPVAGTVRIAVDGMELTEGSGFTVDAATGLVTLASAPAPGAAVTAGFAFDVPARFDTDRLEVDLSAFEAGAIPTIPVVEIRL
jgi:uncharacterized protein (TIGR02217 family)